MPTRLVCGAILLALAACGARADQRADAVLLVNSASDSYADAQHFIRPYLDSFGVPYTVLDIATTPVGPGVADYALIIVGHRRLDPNHGFLDSGEQANITAAVQNGAGLVNFDNDLSPDGSAARYEFVRDIFGFGYLGASTGSNVTFPGSAHYITARHGAGDVVATGAMTLAGIVLEPPAISVADVAAASQSFLAVTTHGQGRAVQWGSYGWMSVAVKGPVYGLDDLVWRSLVWAARKPFVMQGLPHFLTMRVDDTQGDFAWLRTANEFGLKPWLGLFYSGISDSDAAVISSLVNAGLATASVHSKADTSYFYYDHSNQADLPDVTVAANFDDATAWHAAHNIPISKFVAPHFYELGTNVFSRLHDWGVEFVATHMTPGAAYGAPWLQAGPYRLFEPGRSNAATPVWYADYLVIPGHPELANRFFNCVTEIRDDAGYEWYPDNNLAPSIARGTRQSQRAMDSMALATLFTHESSIHLIDANNWRTILAGITSNLASDNPIYVTLDYACQYVRATRTSDVATSRYDPATRNLTTTLSGAADIATKFYVFSNNEGGLADTLVDAPAFSGSTQVVYCLPGPLSRIAVTPSSAATPTGGIQQFGAQGYDADNIPIPGLPYVWSASAGGSIDQQGLFTAGAAPGVFTNAMTVSVGAAAGRATVEVYAAVIDHFVFDPIVGPVYATTPFPVRVTAYDQRGAVMKTYAGPAALSDTTGTITPLTTGSFAAGAWSGNGWIWRAAPGVTITASAGGAVGVSSAFDALPPTGPLTITIPCWLDGDQAPVLATTTNPDALNPTDGQWTEFWYPAVRPYPAVFAGADEHTYGLPVMRFYAAGVPPGVYNVTAGLYTAFAGRNMRYFYGFQPDAPAAYSVDTVGGDGGVEQFSEHSLGTVTITDGTFNIYARDAAVLSGTYPFFGWSFVGLRTTLDHIVVTPGSAIAPPGGRLQFAAQGYDAAGALVPGLTYVWTATAGGSIDQTGLFTAGATPGAFAGAIVASSNGVSGHASANVAARTLNHFAFDPVAGPVYAGFPFNVGITAYDQFGSVLTTYAGTARLSDTTGTVEPAMTAPFVAGVWSWSARVQRDGNDVTITAVDGTGAGTSSGFDVLPLPGQDVSGCWQDSPLPLVLAPGTNSGSLLPVDGARAERFLQVCLPAGVVTPVRSAQ